MQSAFGTAGLQAVPQGPRSRPMTAETDLLPLPPLHIAPSVEPVDYPNVAQALMDYARANVAHATAPLQAEVEALRAEVDEWKRVAAAQAELHGEAEERADRLREGLREADSKFPPLYHAINATMLALGRDGQVTTRHPAV